MPTQKFDLEEPKIPFPIIEFSRKSGIYTPGVQGGERVKWGTLNPQKILASTYDTSTVWYKIKKLEKE